MAEDTKIEWADHTFNPWMGCTKISDACANCYAEKLVNRFDGDFATRTRTSAANWSMPLRWNARAMKLGIRYRVFCASLADVFDNQVPSEWRTDLWNLIRSTAHLDWLLLTKRPQNIAAMLPSDWGDGYPHVWLGTTVENQTEADRRIPHLLAVPAAVRFLSCEPLLGPVELECIPWPAGAKRPADDPSEGFHALKYRPRHIDWVICGGESGPGARPMHPDWARSLRDQCEAAGVAFHFKQWGEWAPVHQIAGVTDICAAPPAPDHWAHPHRYRVHGGPLDGRCYESLPHQPDIMRVGKKAAGRLLDGSTWDQFPKVGAV